MDESLLFEFCTEGQKVMIDSFKYSVTKSCTVLLLDNPGSGFKHTISKFFRTSEFSDIKVITIPIIDTTDTKKVVVEIYKRSSSIKFSGLKYRTMTAHEMLIRVGGRLRQDLLGKRILIIFDHVENLGAKEKMVGFIALIKSIPFKCGVILRTNNAHLAKINNNNMPLHTTILTEFERKTVPTVSQEDVKTMCHAYGVKDVQLIYELSKKQRNLKVVRYYIKRATNLPITSQLSLFE